MCNATLAAADSIAPGQIAARLVEMDAIDTRIDPGRLLKLTRRCSRADRATFNTRNLRNFKSERTDDALRNANGHPSYSAPSTSSTFALRSTIVLRRPPVLWLLLAFGEYPFRLSVSRFETLDRARLAR